MNQSALELQYTNSPDPSRPYGVHTATSGDRNFFHAVLTASGRKAADKKGVTPQPIASAEIHALGFRRILRRIAAIGAVSLIASVGAIDLASSTDDKIRGADQQQVAQDKAMGAELIATGAYYPVLPPQSPPTAEQITAPSVTR